MAQLANVDPDAMSGDRALEWVTSLATARNLVDALMAPFASRLEALSEGPSRFARWKGFPSASALLAGATGLAQVDAARLISLGRAMTREVEVVPEPEPLDLDALAGLPHAPSSPTPRLAPPAAPVRELSPLAKVARDGSLGEPKIRVIAQTLDDITVDSVELEAFLVERARMLSLKELRVLCLREFARLDPRGYAERQHVQRSRRELKFYPRPDGMVGMTGQLDVETAGHVLALFDAEVRAALQEQRDWNESEQRTVLQINADVLASLARHANGCEQATTRPKTTMVVRISEESLRERVGVGACDSLEAPISIDRLRRMAVDAEVVPVVMGGASLPVDVGRARRYFTRAQRVALGERDEGCAMCHRPLAWCDAHHIDWWKHGGGSDLANGVMLCVGCHHRVHDCGWIVEVSGGDVTFVPPSTVDVSRRRQPSSSARLAAR